jgi:chemotaxis protein CheC
MRSLEIDQIQLDALREISSIAAGNTATSLSIMLGKKVNITVPKITVESLENVPEALGGKENAVNVVYFSVSGRVPGYIFLILPLPEASRLASALTGQAAAQSGNLDEMGRSALKELGNIITGTYLSTVSQVLGLRISHSVPGFAADMLGAILDGILARLSLKAVYVVIVENEFRVEKDVYGTHLVFVPEPEALKIMLKALGVWKK